MKKFILFLLIFPLHYIDVHAQVSPSTYIVKFKDKVSSPYNSNSPSVFLSQRAITRRVNQNISIIEQDFPVNPGYVNTISTLGVQVLNRSKWLNAISIYCTDSISMVTIQNLPFVQSVEAVKRRSNTPVGPKLEPEIRFNSIASTKILTQIDFRNLLDYGPSFNQVSMLGGDLMHLGGFMGNGKVIAVIDAGFSIANQCETFDSVFINNQILGTWDFVSGDANVYDDSYHGTYVLSTMAGNTPGQLIGTAPKASYWLLRSEDAPTEFIVEEFNWVCAAEFADSVGADVINSSLGYTTFDNPTQDHTFSDLNGTTAMASIAAEIAASKGIIVCNSAGNSGDNSWLRIAVPADANHILTVGAVDSAEFVANFSSRGHSFDGRIKPDVAAQGVATVGQYLPGIFVVGNGTSFASPLIAGMCASLWEAVPNLTAAEVIQKIKESCDQYTTPDSLKGYGIPNFAQAYYTVSGNKIAYPTLSKIDLVAPNPFTDFIKVRYYAVDTQFVEIRIYDILGKEIISKKQFCETRSYNTLDFQMPFNLSKGMYFMQILTKQEKVGIKLIKE